jgi:hypothetical protein
MKKQLLALFLAIFVFTKFASAQTITSLDTIQRIHTSKLAVGRDTSELNLDTVWVQGICTFNPCLYAQSGSAGYPQRVATWLQTPGSTSWGGLQIMLDPGAIGLGNASATVHNLDATCNFINNFQPGNLVKCRGIVSNFAGNTQFLLLNQTTVALGISALPAPVVVTIDTFSKINAVTSVQDIQYVSGEKYEGMYVQINNAIVTDVSTTTANRYRWAIKDGAGNKIVIQDNVSGNFTNTAYDQFCTTGGVSYTPNVYTGFPNGTALTYVKGIIVQNTNTTTGERYYSIAPIQLSDIGTSTFAPPIISNVTISPFCPTAAQSVNVYANVQDDSTVATVNVHYAFGLANNTFTSVNMTLSTGSTYIGVIPATVTDSTWVKYYIEAIDNFGHTTYYPNQSATNSYYLSINSGIRSIAAIQGRTFSSGKSIYAADSLVNIDVQGVVTATSQTDDLGLVTIQDGTNPYSGIFISGGTVANLHRGERIKITACKVLEILGANQNSTVGVTTLMNPTYTIMSVGNTLPTPISAFLLDSVIANVAKYAEPYEGMLVGKTSVAVIDTNPDFTSNGANFGEFSFHTNPSAIKGLRCDDYSNDINFNFNTDSLLNGQNLCFVNGIMVYAFGNWKMYPRNQSDICGFNTKYSKQITSFTTNAIAAFVYQSAKTIAITLPTGTPITALQPSISFIGQTVTPADGVATDFTNPVVYTVTAPDNTTVAYTVTVTVPLGTLSLKEQTRLTTFPNPAKDQVQINLESSNELGATTVTVYSPIGSIIYSSKTNIHAGMNTISLNTTAYNAGLYLVEFSNASGKTTQTISIVK